MPKTSSQVHWKQGLTCRKPESLMTIYPSNNLQIHFFALIFSLLCRIALLPLPKRSPSLSATTKACRRLRATSRLSSYTTYRSANDGPTFEKRGLYLNHKGQSRAWLKKGCTPPRKVQDPLTILAGSLSFRPHDYKVFYLS